MNLSHQILKGGLCRVGEEPSFMCATCCIVEEPCRSAWSYIIRTVLWPKTRSFKIGLGGGNGAMCRRDLAEIRYVVWLLFYPSWKFVTELLTPRLGCRERGCISCARRERRSEWCFLHRVGAVWIDCWSPGPVGLTRADQEHVHGAGAHGERKRLFFHHDLRYPATWIAVST